METHLGQDFAQAVAQHPGTSGFRIIPTGADGFLTRVEMIRRAERSLDLQYFIFHGDGTGRLLTDAILQAADRGVRVRVLIDDGDTLPGDEQIDILAAHPMVQIRVFNPFAYRGHWSVLRGIEFAFSSSRLDYRMHNKLFVVDGSVALVGGRNIADEYFQMNPYSQFADDDVFAVGPVVADLAAHFDDFWNSPLSIPVLGLSDKKPTVAELDTYRAQLRAERQEARQGNTDQMKKAESGEPLESMVDGRQPLTWARAQVVCDSPDKKKVDQGEMAGYLMRREVVAAARETQSELLMVTPYLVPGAGGMRLLESLRAHDVRVRVLTNSLESSVELLAQAAYTHYRVPMLEHGIQLYELRPLPGNTRGSGQPSSIMRYGNYSLHAKLFVFDRKRVFIGSMNFDRRSLHLNTEIGLLIDSPELARQVAARFDAMTDPANVYIPELRAPASASAVESVDAPQGASKTPAELVWRIRTDGTDSETSTEPARDAWQRLRARFLALLPADDEL
jgi:putative cardiolipin synthase